MSSPQVREGEEAYAAGGVDDEPLFELCQPTWPRITILKMTEVPAIDGRITKEEWRAATPMSGFLLFGSSRIASPQPRVWVGWNDTTLLIAAEIPLPSGEKAKANATDWDGTVWQDDSVEIHVDPHHKHGSNYQFVVNALGTKLDSLGGDFKFNAQWEARAINEPGRWCAEFAIPWKAMGREKPESGQIDGFNIAINETSQGRILIWSPSRGSLHSSQQYGHFVYGDSIAMGFSQLDPERLHEGRGVALGKGTVSLSMNLLERGDEGKTKTIDTVNQNVQAPGEFSFPICLPTENDFRKAGTYIVEVRGVSHSGLLYVQHGEVRIGSALRLSVKAFITEKYLNITIDPDRAAFPQEETDVDVKITGTHGVALEKRLSNSMHLRVDGATLPSGRIVIRASATNRRTRKTFAVEKTLDDPLQPAWLGTREGITAKVPAPWTPLKVEGDAVKPWGRVYRFRQSFLPTEVTTRGASVLTGPIGLYGKVNGESLKWQNTSATFTRREADIVALTGRAEGEAVMMQGTTSIEYDGMIRVDVNITPRQDAATIENLVLEVPFKTQHARYLYHFPGRWGSVDNSGFLPGKGWSHAFKPFVWLGDEDRGFAWFCESDQNWFPADSNRAIEIVRDKDRVTLRLNLIGKPTEIGRQGAAIPALKYTFGFQATPVKEPEKTVWDYRITHHGTYGLEKQPSSLGGVITYPAKKNLDPKQGSFECCYRPAFDTERELPVAQRKHMGNRPLFTVKWGGDIGTGSNCGLYWNEIVQGLVAWSRKNGTVTHYQEAPFDWKAGEWHYLGMTWGEDTIRIYIDGKMLSEKPCKEFFPHELKEARIEIGGPTAFATVDEVRILNVARAPTPAEQKLQWDAHTLLLDHFEDYGRKGTVTPGLADEAVCFTNAKFGKGPTWEPEKAKTQLQRLAEMGVRTICFHEHWSPYQSHPYVTEDNRPKLQSLVEACHQHRISLLLYMSRQFADNAPEWELYADEVLQEPRGGAYHRLPEQKAYIVCWNSAWKDFCLHHLAKLIDEFGHDGWYLDGHEWPMACANRHHGCGYEAPDGSIRPTYDIFATRDFLKRLYILTRQRKPQGQLNIHNSTVMVIPTLGWGTSSWGGEQIDAIKPPVKTLDILPMDAFRTEFMGRQWGVPSEFLVYDGMPYYAKDVLAYTLLHGVLIRPFDFEALTRIAALWKVYDRFPLKDAEMPPYWNNSRCIQCSPDKVYATAYRKPKEGLLLFISNLGEADADVHVRLNLCKLGLRADARAWDAVTGEEMKTEAGILRFLLQMWRYRVVRIQNRCGDICTVSRGTNLARRSENMRIAVDGVYFGVGAKRPWRELITLCKEVGATGVNWPMHPEYLNREDAVMTEEVIHALDEADLGVLSLGITKQLSATPGSEQEYRDAIAQAVEVAPRLKCRVLDCWPCRPKEVSKEKAQETLAENMLAVAPLVEKAGCVVSLEFEPDTTIERYQEALDFVNQFPAVIRLTADTYHIIRIGDNLVECARAIVNRFGMVHLSGSHRGEPGSEGDKCDHAAFVGALRAGGYADDYVLQYAPPPDTTDSLTRAVRFVARL